MKTTQMKNGRLVSALLCSIAASALCAGHAMAQQTASNGTSTSVGEIVVTGTRIAAPNETSVSPITAVSADTISLEGRTDVGDIINNLPQSVVNAVSDLGTASNPLNGPGGISNADLRGLGPQRTLVLIDGQRLGIGDANTQNNNAAPDLNQIPTALIDHVEVVTGGASATYGSDAIAGVVNFVMKHDFEGLQFDLHGNVYQHDQDDASVDKLLKAAGPGFSVPKDAWDGYGGDADLIFGANSPDGKGNVTGYVEYHHQNPILQGERDFSSCQIKLHAGFTPYCTGSPNSNEFILNTGSGSGAIGGDGYTVIGTNFVNWDTANATGQNGNPPLFYNSNPVETLLHQDSRYMGGFFAHYDMSKYVNFYGTFSMMQDKQVTQVAPSGFFEGSGVTPNAGFLVNCNNPLLSAQEQGVLCSPADIASGNTVDLLIGRRAIEDGGRSSEYDHVNYRAVAGVKGDIAGSWKYNAYAQYYWTSLYQDNFNYWSQSRMQDALLVGGTAANPVCLSGDAGCVPLNIFNQTGLSPAQVAWVNSYGTSYGTIQEVIGEADITGDLGDYGLKSPMATGGVQVSIGVQSRDDKYNYAPDQASLQNDLSGFGGAGTIIHNQTLDVVEYYGEFRAPLIQDQPFFKDLTLSGGYRYSVYSTGVSPSTYKAGLEWSPDDQLRFRASFNRAIRAPNIVELYNPASVTNTSDVSVDPCSPTHDSNGNLVPATASLAQCEHTGVTAAQYGNGGTTDIITQCPAGQCAVLNGGNRNLKPETADTFSVGATFRPSFLKGFTGSIDYFHIKEQNLINTIPLATTLNNCLTTGAALFCNNVVRAPNGILFGTAVVGGGYINGEAANVAAGVNDGIDIQLGYDVDLNDWHLGDNGRLIFALNGSDMIKSTTTPLPGEHSYDCAGLFGNTCQTVNPKWRHDLRVSWQAPFDVLFSADWRFISSVKWEGNTKDPTLGSGGAFDTFDHIPNYSYIDLSARWNVKKGVALTAGVNNVFDKNPPVLNDTIAGTGLPNTYPTYDILGREFFAQLTTKF